MRNLLKNCFYGLAIGSVINTVLQLLFTEGSTRLTILIFTILSFIFGASGSIYDINRLTLLGKTCLQLSIVYSSFLILAFIGGWFHYTVSVILITTFLFFSIFFIIWTILYFIEKKEIEKINSRIK